MSMHAKTLAVIASADQTTAGLYETLADAERKSGCPMLDTLMDLTFVGDVIVYDPAAVAAMPIGKRRVIKALLLLGLSDFIRRYDAELTAMVEGAQ